MIDGELGAFLRSRREALSPTAVGLPVGARRRTPGLRRAELATLAGVSVDYLTRLEQGRDTHPSTQVLAALADALRFNDDDLAHLHQLAVISNGTELICNRARAGADRTVRSTVRAVLALLEPASAYVVNHRGDLLAWTDGYDRVARPLGILDGDEPNLLAFVFTDARSRDVFSDWDAVADEQVAALHELRHGDTTIDAFADALGNAAGPEFADRWQRRPLGAQPVGVSRITHPIVGPLRLAYETLDLAEHDRQRLVVHIPADPATEAALDRLAGRQPGAVRTMNAS